MDLYYNKRLASIDGVTVYFTTPPVLRGSNAYLNEKDLLLVLDPVLRGKALAKYPVRTIMIDPGHGGTDKGAAGAGGSSETAGGFEKARFSGHHDPRSGFHSFIAGQGGALQKV